MEHISIHALCEEGDEKAGPRYRAPVYFYPRPLRGGRRSTESLFRLGKDFYPRPLRGGRRSAAQIPATPPNFYPRPLRGGRRAHFAVFPEKLIISIHALCEEGDGLFRLLHALDRISIHALCEEGDPRAILLWH